MSLPKSPKTRREFHGKTNSRAYSCWLNMHARCRTPSASGYRNYGGRGISVCERWHSFSAFLEDMGDPPAGTSIERKDGNGNYEPGNCKWATRKEQNRNQFDLRYLTHNGKTQCLAAWAEEVGIPDAAIRTRLKNKWSVDRALTQPVRPHKVYERRAS